MADAQESGFLLRVRFPSGEERNFQWSKDRCRIGRAEDADLRLDDAWSGAQSVSRRHASIVRVGARFRVVDNESKNGVYLNDARVHAEWLHTGDVIRIGDYELAYRELRPSGSKTASTSHIVGFAKSKKLGSIQILDSVHEGPLSVVLKGKVVGSGAILAIKCARFPEQVERLANEWTVFEALKESPGIVPCVGKATVGDLPALLLSWMPGGSLRQWIQREQRLALPLAAGCFAELARSLADIHRLGYVHNDVKPSNVLLNGRSVPVWSDFGATARTGSESGILVASPLYMAPEREQQKAAQAPSDVYSLGCSLFEALTGRSPFAGVSEGDIQQRKNEGAFDKGLLKDQPHDLQVSITSALEPSPMSRPTAQEISKILTTLS